MSPASTVRYVKIDQEPLSTGDFVILKTIEHAFDTKFLSSEGVSQPRATQQKAQKAFSIVLLSALQYLLNNK